MITVRDLIDASSLKHPRPYEEIEAVLHFRPKPALANNEYYFIEEMATASKMSQNFMGDWAEAQPEFEEPNSPEPNSPLSPGRMQRIGALASEQALVFHRIMTAVRDQERQHPAHTYMSTMCPPTPSSSSRMPSPRYRPSTAAKTEKPNTREVNARIVAEKLQEKQAREEMFHRNREQCRVESEKRHEAFCTALENSDKLHAQRQQERSQKLNEKIYNQQQKHSDQKKMLHEIQRDQDRQWKLLQSKTYSHQMRRPSSSPALLRKKKKTHVNDQQDQVYADLKQSHRLYNGTIANWQEMEADNERRAEAMWQKKLPGGKQAKHDDAGHEARQKVKRVTSKLTTASKIIRSNSCEECTPSERFRVRTPSEASTTTDAFDPGEDRCMDTTPWGIWEARMERCREVQRDLQQAHQEKRMKDMERLEMIRTRGKEETQKRAKKAEAVLASWDKKSTMAAQKRASQSKSNEAEYFAKQEVASMVRAETMAIEMELRDQSVAAAENHREVTLNNSKQLRASRAQNRKSTMEHKGNRAKANLEIQIEGYISPTAKQHLEEARIKIETKQAYEDEFRKKAEAGILEKEFRGQQRNSLLKVKMADSPREALTRLRSAKKDKRKITPSLLEAPKLELADGAASELQPPAVILTPSHGTALPIPVALRRKAASDADDVEGGDNTRSSAGDDIELAPRDADGCLSRPRSSNSRASKNSWPNSRAPSKMQVSHSNSTSPRGGTRLSDTGPCDDSSSSADEDFLQELRTRSSKWLEEAKTKSHSERRFL